MNSEAVPTEFEVDAIPVSTNNINPIEEFIQTQIRLWGFESVQRMFDEGFEPINVDGKVLWAK